MGESNTNTEPTGKPFRGFDFDDFDGCVASVGSEVDDPEAFCQWLKEEGKQALSDPHAEEVLPELQVEYVSAVDTPAQDSEWVIAKDAEDPDGNEHRWKSEVTLYVSKSGERKDDDVKQVAFAPVLIPKEADKQGDVIPMPAIEDAAHTYLAEARKVDSDHDLREGKGVPVESWTLKQDTTFDLPDGSESRTYPKGTWVMGIKFDDPTWERVESGDLSGLSIYGGAKPVDVERLLGKGIDTTEKSDDGDDADVDSDTMGSEEDSPDDPGNDEPETTSKQDLNADQVSAMLSEFGSMVEDGGIDRGATVEEFVRGLIDDGNVEEGQITGLSVFLGGGGGGGDPEPEADESDEDDDENAAFSDDDDVSLSGDGGDDPDGDVDKADVEPEPDTDDDTDDVEKSADDTDADFDDAPEWAKALKSQVDDLRDKVEDVPRSDKMENDDQLSDRIAKDLTGADDADVARKAIREQVAKSDDSGPEVDYSGITDDENAGSDASGSSSNGSMHSAGANKRMAGGDN